MFGRGCDYGFVRYYQGSGLKLSGKANRQFDQGYAGRKAPNFNREGNGYYFYRLWAA